MVAAGEGLTLAGPAAVLPFSVPDRGGISFTSQGTSPEFRVGYGQVETDDGMTPPVGLAIFGSRLNGILASEVGVPASAAVLEGRIFAETDGPVRTGLALANTSGAPTTVRLELTELDGTATGSTESLTIPASGHVARFIDEFFPALTTPFSGILRIASAVPDIAAVGLRLAINQRDDILVTTTPPVDENAAPTASGLFFPHFVDSGGWTTQFILFSGSQGQTASGVIRFTGQDGQPLELSVAPTAPPTIP